MFDPLIVNILLLGPTVLVFQLFPSVLVKATELPQACLCSQMRELNPEWLFLPRGYQPPATYTPHASSPNGGRHLLLLRQWISHDDTIVPLLEDLSVWGLPLLPFCPLSPYSSVKQEAVNTSPDLDIWHCKCHFQYLGLHIFRSPKWPNSRNIQRDSCMH